MRINLMHYQLLTGITACVTRLGVWAWGYYRMGRWIECDGLSRLWHDLAATPWSSFWW